MYYYYDPIIKSKALKGLSRKSAIWVIHHRIVLYIYIYSGTQNRVISKLFKSLSDSGGGSSSIARVLLFI